MAYTIDSLKFSNRLKNVLKRNGCFYVDQLLELTEEDLNSFRGIGKKTMDEVLDFQTRCNQIGDRYIESMLDNTKDLAESTIDESTKIIDVILDIRVSEKDRILFKNKDGLYVEDYPLQVSPVPQGVREALKRAGCNTIRKVAFKKYRELEFEKGFGQKKMDALLNSFSSDLVKISINHFEKRKNTEEIYARLETALNEHETQFDIISVRSVLYELIDENYLELEKILVVDKCSADELVERTVWNSPKFINEYKNYIIQICSDSWRISIEKNWIKFPVVLNELGVTSRVFNELCSERVLEIDEDGFFMIVRPTIQDWIGKLEGNQKRIIIGLLDGKTYEECGRELDMPISRERVRQIKEKAIKNKLILQEDIYQYWYEKYNLDEVRMCSIFNLDSKIYRYLKMLYKPGVKNLEEMFDDEFLSRSQRTRLVDYTNKDKVLIEGEYVECTRDAICEKLAEMYYSDESVNYEDFYERYKLLLEEKGLEKNSRLICPSDDSIRAFKARLEDCNFGLSKPKNSFRYYPIQKCDINSFIEQLNLKQFKDVEVSSLKIYRDNVELMREYNILDEYELHNLMKKTSKIWNANNYGLKFKRMPTLQFGECNREQQVFELLKRYAPIRRDEFCEAYEEEYGFSANTVAADFLNSINEYYNNEIYDIEQPLFTEEEKLFMNSILVGDMYFMEDVLKEYIERFGYKSRERVNTRSLKNLGFRTYSKFIIRDKYTSSEAYFRELYLNRSSFSSEDYDSRLGYIQSSSKVLSELKSRYEILEYERGEFVTMNRLNEFHPSVTKQVLSEYASKTIESIGNHQFETIKSLRNKGCDCFDEMLVTLGFDDWFASSIVRYSGRIRTILIGNECVFYRGEEKLFSEDFIKWVIQKFEKKNINIYELCEYLEDEYGIITNKERINALIENSSLYYDKITGKVYYNKENYYEEFKRRE